MKKFIALLLAVVLVAGMTACGAKKAASDSDMAYVKEKGKGEVAHRFIPQVERNEKQEP